MRSKLLAAVMSAVVAVTSLNVPASEHFAGIAVTAEAATTVSAPEASLKTGTYTASGAKSVTLTCPDSKATIYYSLNGASYKKYTGAIKISKNSTLKVYAKSGSAKSSTKTYKYNLKPQVDINISNWYDSNGGTKSVFLSTKLSGVTLYYTTDGSTPTTKSKVLRLNGISTSKDCTIKVLAVKSGWTDALYTVDCKIHDLTAHKQKGLSGYGTPAAGKTDMVASGKKVTGSAEFYVSEGGYNGIQLTVGNKNTYFILGKEGKLSSLTKNKSLGDNDMKKDDWCVLVENWDVSKSLAGKTADSSVQTSMFDKIIFKAVDVDYTGKKASTFFFYVLAHDSAEKTFESIEGTLSVIINTSGSSGSGSGGSGGSSGSGGSGSGGSSDGTGKKGQSYFNTPAEGKADILYGGKRAEWEAKHYTSLTGADCIKLTSGGNEVLFNFGKSNLNTYTKGKTLSLSDFTGSKEPNLNVKGWKVCSSLESVMGGTLYSGIPDKTVAFDEIVFKVIDINYAGTGTSKFYVYIQAHDGKGTKESFEGIVNVTLNKGSGSGSGSSGGGSGSSGTGSTTKKGQSYFSTPDEGKADVLFHGSKSSWDSKHYIGGLGDDCIKVTNGSAEAIFIIGSLSGYTAGKTLSMSDLKSSSASLQIKGWNISGSKSIFSNTKSDMGSITDVTLKVISIDYTGAKPSQFYFYILATSANGSTKESLEGIINVTLNKPSEGGSGGGGTLLPFPDIQRSETHVCSVCTGTGKCSGCRGTGKVYYGTKGEKVNCFLCHGSATCQSCKGTGKITVTW